MCLIPLAPAVKTPGLLPIGAKGIRHDPFQGTYVPPFRSPSNFFQLPWLCSSGAWRAACKCHRSHFGSRYKLGCCGHAGLFDHGFEPGWELHIPSAHSISGGPSYLASVLLNLDAVMCCAAVCHHKYMETSRCWPLRVRSSRLIPPSKPARHAFCPTPGPLPHPHHCVLRQQM